MGSKVMPYRILAEVPFYSKKKKCNCKDKQVGDWKDTLFFLFVFSILSVLVILGAGALH